MTLTTTHVDSRIATYMRSRDAGVAYILQHVNDDGSIGPVERGVFYARVPWVLAVSGATVPAMRLVAWIRAHMLTADGEVAGEASPEGGANRVSNTYAETCLAYGAQLLRQFDVAQATISNAMRYQDPVTGGIYMDRSRTGPDAPQLLFPTAQFGMSALVTGQIDAALKVGGWFKRVWDEQPELPERLYTVYTQSGLVRETPPGADPRHYINESQQMKQMHYNGGIAATFLARLYLATGDQQWLDLARAYQAFSMNSTELQFQTAQVCKSGWGASLLYSITGEEIYRDWAIKMGDWFVSNQYDDGHWENSHYIDPDPPLHNRLTITAEFINHMDCIAGGLAAGAIR